MSGVKPIEALSAISLIISVIDGTKQVYDAATSDCRRPSRSLWEVVGRLPIVTNNLDISKQYIKEGDANDDALYSIKACLEKARKLEEDLFQKFIPGDSASIRQRYISAVRNLGKGNEVEKLMKGILEELATKVQQEQIAKAIAEGSAVTLSVQKNEAGFTANYSSSARGYLAQGNVRLYNSGGGAMHFDKD